MWYGSIRGDKRNQVSSCFTLWMFSVVCNTRYSDIVILFIIHIIYMYVELAQVLANCSLRTADYESTASMFVVK